jgi:hypothetical protein
MLAAPLRLAASGVSAAQATAARRKPSLRSRARAHGTARALVGQRDVSARRRSVTALEDGARRIEPTKEEAMRSTTTKISALALVAAALIATGCGGSSKPAHSRATTTTAGAMSVKAYLAEVTRINQQLQDKNSAYFHGSGGAALLRPVQTAYSVTATKLAALRPPAAARDKQARLVAFYRAAARKLARVLARRPFDSNRASTVAINSSERGGQLYSDLFSIPG